MWLPYWMEIPTTKEQQHPRNMAVYGGLAGGAVILSFLASFLFYFIVSNGSLQFHGRMVESVLKSPMEFFNTNKANSILSRFSYDTRSTDMSALNVLFSLLNQLAYPIVIAVVVCWANHWIILAAIPLSVLLVCYCNYFIVATEQLKTLVTVTAAPLYIQFADTARGIATVRNHGQQARFLGAVHR